MFRILNIKGTVLDRNQLEDYMEKLASLYGKNEDVLPICNNKRFVSYTRFSS